ncbi:MAG: hypothetical protein B6U72_03105 [Candidatus Altiarchaeales archaeon ex4484_2]|nr:MAG: hypothetical protein B6U72_03105 [Candidatus Altiarchaeales archaeon ex4484_2]
MRYDVALMVFMVFTGVVVAEEDCQLDLTIYKNDTVRIADVKIVELETTPERNSFDDVTNYSLGVYAIDGTVLYKTYLPVDFRVYEMEEFNNSFESFYIKKPVGERDYWQTEIIVPCDEMWIFHRNPIFVYRFDEIKDERCQLGYNGVCDPDCSDLDPDCIIETSTTLTSSSTTVGGGESSGGNLLLYLLTAAVLLVTAFFVYRKREENKQAEEKQRKRRKLIEWIGEQLRDGEDPKKLKTVVRSQGFEPELVDYVERRL